MGGGGGGLGGALGSMAGGLVMGPLGQVAGALGGSGVMQRAPNGQWVMAPPPPPTRPEFQSLINKESGLLDNKYQTQWGPDVTPDMRGMEAVRERALQKGPSAWAGLALDKAKLDEQGLRESTLRQGDSAAAQARSSLAMKQGLSSGASERLARQAMRDRMMGLQNVGFQGAQARSNIGLQDEQMKNQFLSALPGQENALAGIQLQNKQGNIGTQQWNISNALNEKRAKDAADMAAWQEQMKSYAAGRQSDAMRSAGGGGSGKK